MTEQILSEEELLDLEKEIQEKNIDLPSKPKVTEKKQGTTQPKINYSLEFDLNQFREDVAFDDHTIDQSYQNQASLFAHYAAVVSEYNRAYLSEKDQFEILESKLYMDYRKKSEEEGKKVTEAMLSNLIKCDKRYAAKQKLLREAQANAELVKGALEALRHKRDMLIQRGADLREEYKGELRMKSAPTENYQERQAKALRA